ncbi:hypothetical protein [Leucobacter sp. L43]|uniref:hypothetical protein n=1 Tax=Leucobacter sp. L43 TaxID=2798040 RepID=UPI0019048DDB|nr:hypothetical protein [Leucobacter sp. L43]
MTAMLKAVESEPHERTDPNLISVEEAEKKSAAAILVDLAMERYDFASTPEGEAFAIPRPGGHVVRMLRGGRASLRAELSSTYRKKTGRIAPQQALADAMLVLEGEAQESDPQEVHLRVAESKGVIWIDLGTVAEEAIRIDATGWAIVGRDVPVLFRRTALTGPMPTPERGGSLDDLWSVLNVAAVDRPLVLAWLVAALGAPAIPHPVMALFGEQGTGKSSASKALVTLADPSPVPLRKPPRDADGWVTAASGSWVVGLDNLSTVPDWLSDTLCRAVTGDGDVRRQLYTDSGLSVFSFRRAILLNGIDLAGMRGDLAERLVTVSLATIPEHQRISERELSERWERVYPRLVGVLLDQVAGMAGQLSYVRLDSAPRMADFAHILAALDKLNATDGLSRYMSQAATLAGDSLASDPFIVALMSSVNEFEGSAAELLDTVLSDMQDGWRPPRDWPKNARAITGILKRNAPALRKSGWVAEDLGSANKEKVTIWKLARPEIARNDTPPYPPNPPKPQYGGEAGNAWNKNGQPQDESDLFVGWDDPGYCEHGTTIGSRCSSCGGTAREGS